MVAGKRTTTILLVAILVVLFLPMVQEKFHLFTFKPLAGAFIPANEPTLTRENWFSGKFQDSADKYLTENFGFRTVLVKGHNQAEYALFRNTNVKDVYAGKNDYLYEINYLKAWRGDNFAGYRKLRLQAAQMKALQDSLAKEGITFLFVIAPSKTYYVPEHLPAAFAKEGSVTNYKVFTALTDSLGVNMIDFNDYFVKNRQQLKYPVYHPSGVHWSRYASTLAGDSIIRWLERKRQVDMPGLQMGKLTFTDIPRDPDDDMGKTMNLFFPVRSLEMAYPKYTFEDTAGRVRPRMLAIGDSYFWSLWDMGIRDNVFSTIDFWYYNKIASHSDGRPDEDITTIDRYTETRKYDVIMVIVTDPNLGQAGWEYLSAAVQPVDNPERQRKIREVEQAIRGDPAWMEQIRKKAIEKKIPLDEAVRQDAVFMVNEGY